MRYVQRNASNTIVGHFARPQPGYAEEGLPDDHPELVAFAEAHARRLADSTTLPRGQKLERLLAAHGLTKADLLAELAAPAQGATKP